MELMPKSCLVVQHDTEAIELERFQLQDDQIQQPEIEHIFIMGVDFSESPHKLQLLENIFRTRKTKWRAVTLDRCEGPVEVLLTALLLNSNAETVVENLTLNSLHLSLPIARALMNGLQWKERRIQKISFCGCRWTTNSVALCLQGLKKNDSIHTVRFNGGVFCDPDVSMMALANAIGRCHRIKRLELFSCGLSDVCVASLVSSLHQMNELEYLDLGRNACNSLGLEALGKLLERSTTLQTVNLSIQECPTTFHSSRSLDLRLLTAGLRNNGSLRNLYLRGNRLDDKAVDALIEVLLHDSSCIERLILTDCVISNARIHSLVDKLQNMTSIRALWLDGVQDIKISGRCLLHQAALRSLQSKNTSLEVLKFPFGSIDSTSAIQHLLDLNRGGRRLVFDGKTKSCNTVKFPSSCWPLVLERVNQLPFDAYSPGILSSAPLDQLHGRLKIEHDLCQERTASTLYYFLRQKILVES